MSKWRFLKLFAIAIILSISFACTQTITGEVKVTETLAERSPLIQPENKPTAAPLPPETAAIVASVGSKDLFTPPRGDVRIAVISDLNGVYGATDYEPEVDKAIALLPFWQPDLVLCSGDMVAGQNPALTTEEIKAMWTAFDDHVTAPLRRYKIPFGLTIGNHDASSALGVEGQYLFQQERDLAAAYWQNPQHDPGVQFGDRFEFPFYYTFEARGIFFLVWDGSSSHIPADKLAWVEKTLANPQAQQGKMRILLGHLPLYGVAVGRDEPGEVMDNSEELRAMLERYNVHTYISGHHHAYYPGHRGKLQLLHTGILGSGMRPLIDSSLQPQKTLSIVDIDFDTASLSTYTTYDMQTLQLIDMEKLPRFLTAHNGIVLRRDVEMADLKPDEKASCQQRLGSKLCGLK
ncbi:metallophosphoesterase family protein [Myxosarcina sp. GI1(2024)]